MINKIHLILIMLPIMAGCTGNASEFQGELEQVDGKVIVNGQPEANVQVSFIPTGETQGTGAMGTTDEQGQFQLMHRSGQPGIETGKYRVVFSKIAKPDGSPVAPEEDAATVGSEQIPPRYSNLDLSREVTEVVQGENEFLFDLKFKTVE